MRGPHSGPEGQVVQIRVLGSVSPPTSAEGLGLLLILVSQLTATEARDLKQPIAKATTFIGTTCPAGGGCPPGTNKHWYGDNGRRIDLEVWSCVAFTP